MNSETADGRCSRSSCLCSRMGGCTESVGGRRSHFMLLVRATTKQSRAEEAAATAAFLSGRHGSCRSSVTLIARDTSACQSGAESENKQGGRSEGYAAAPCSGSRSSWWRRRTDQRRRRSRRLQPNNDRHSGNIVAVDVRWTTESNAVVLHRLRRRR